jgi:hypothetical protein
VRDSLDGRRTTNAQVKNAQPGLRNNFFFLQLADRGKHWPGLTGTGSRRSAVSDRADGAGSGFGFVWMVVGRLRHRRPQHQGQAEPHQPSRSKPHAFLHWARFSLAYMGCMLKAIPGRCFGRHIGRTDTKQTSQRTNGLTLYPSKSLGKANISPASRQRTAHSSRPRYCSNLSIFPSHSVPDELVTTTTLGTSQGPTHPLIVNCTRFNSPRLRHSLLSQSTGTSGNPRSLLPQQQPGRS